MFEIVMLLGFLGAAISPFFPEEEAAGKKQTAAAPSDKSADISTAEL